MKYPNCPKCAGSFDLKGTFIIVDNCIGIDLYNAKINRDQIDFALFPTDPISFVDRDIIFSIRSDNYSIECSNDEAFEDFIDIGSITIEIDIGCSDCAHNRHLHESDHGFGATFRLTYDRDKLDFSDAFLAHSEFNYMFDGYVYYFINHHNYNHSWLSRYPVDDLQCSAHTTVNTIMIPLDTFDFSNPEKVLAKLNSIFLLS